MKCQSNSHKVWVDQQWQKLYCLDRMNIGVQFGGSNIAQFILNSEFKVLASATVEVLLSRDLVGSDSGLVKRRHSELVAALMTADLLSQSCSSPVLTKSMHTPLA